MEIKKLSAEVKKNGFIYKLIERNENKCLYAQTKNNEINGYEVFKIKISKDRFAYDALYEPFPYNEEFGKRAWYYQHLNNAMKKYNTI